jgi:pimeloyl-ACP methyl ester carboxylesterase
VSVQAREAGRGDAVLCLRGTGSSSRSFAEHLSGWRGRRQALARVVPGYGAAIDHTELLSTLRVPALAVCGEHDVGTSSELSHQIAALVPGVRLAMVPDPGRVSNQEQAGALDDLVEAFLDEGESGASTSATPEVRR